MNVLIIGGAGYVGAGLVEELNRPGTKISKIRIYDNLSRGNYNLFLTGKFKHSNLELVQGDILDARSLKKAVAGMDVVYHLAARVTTPFANLDPHMYEQVNHWGTADVVAAIEDSEVAQLIYLSSTSVYGASQVAANENTPPILKRFMEFLSGGVNSTYNDWLRKDVLLLSVRAMYMGLARPCGLMPLLTGLPLRLTS